MSCTWKRLWRLGLAFLLACALGGCAAPSGVKSLFTLPKLPIEYNDLARQINALIADGYEYASPISGRRIQSVQMVDLDGDGDEEAIAFFRRSGDEKPLKIFVFSSNDETFEKLCTIESSGTAVDSVNYQDLTGDGWKELVVGWRIGADVQTMAVYTVRREPTALMQSSYVRYSVEELDGDGVPSMLIFRADEEGNSVAEFYSWRNDTMAVSHAVNLTGTMADLVRGSVVSGRLMDGHPAVYVTGVTEESMAATDILAYRDGVGIVNVVEDAQTGNSGAVFPYMYLRPQDIDASGSAEVPAPRTDEEGKTTGLVDWRTYDKDGRSKLAMTTYHNTAGGWYFVIPTEWSSRVTVSVRESGINETQTILVLNGEEACVIYTLTGENRENRALRGNRQVIRRQSGVTYAGEILPSGVEMGLTEELLRQNFKLISNQWITG